MARSTSCARPFATHSGRRPRVRSSSMPTEPPAETGPAAITIDQGVLVGYPVSRTGASPLVLGAGARLRAGTVLYDGTTIGRRLATGHGVIVREGCEIGDDVSVWSNSVIDYGWRIGDRVK